MRRQGISLSCWIITWTIAGSVLVGPTWGQATAVDDRGTAAKKAAPTQDAEGHGSRPINPPLAGTPPAPEAARRSPQEIEKLVAQLGSEKYVLRKSAQDQLAETGLAARQQLLAGLRSQDAEIRRSCRRILADVLAADFQEKVLSFERDTTGTGDHDLPGWRKYREMVGHGPEARRYFLDMLKNEEGLLASLEAGPQVAGQALQSRFNMVYRQAYQVPSIQRKQPSVGTLMTMMFIAADPDLQLPTAVMNNHYWYSLLMQSPLKQAVYKKDAKEHVARKLLGRWLLRPSNSTMVYNKLRLALQYRIPEGLDLALTAMHDKKLSASYRTYAISAVGQLGGKKYCGKLLSLLNDKTVCIRRTLRINNVRQQMNVEIRDVALGWLLHLTGQDLSRYGMPNARSAFARSRRTPTYLMSASYFYFSRPGQRETALKKWKEWQLKNKLPAVPAKTTVTAATKVPNSTYRGGITRLGGFGGGFIPNQAIIPPRIQIVRKPVIKKKVKKKPPVKGAKKARVRPPLDQPKAVPRPKPGTKSGTKPAAASKGLRKPKKDEKPTAAADKANGITRQQRQQIEDKKRRALKALRGRKPARPQADLRQAVQQAIKKSATKASATKKSATKKSATKKPAEKKAADQRAAALQRAQQLQAAAQQAAQNRANGMALLLQQQAVQIQMQQMGRLVPFGVPVPPQSKKKTSPLAGLHLPVADREMTRRLKKAIKAIDRRQFAEAVILLGSILTEPKDYVFADRRDVPLARGLKAEANKLLGTLPRKGREIYELHYGAEARTMLRQAMASGNIEALTRVAQSFFYTEAGAEAGYLVGEYFMNRNRPLRAALYLERLQEKSYFADQFEPALSFKLATCWVRADMHDRAQQVLVHVKNQHPRAQFRFAGEDHEIFAESRRALEWLTGFIGPHPQRFFSNGWPMYRGAPTRNAVSHDEMPYLDGDPLWSVSNSEMVRATAESLHESYLKKHHALLPSMQPLLVDNLIIVRSATQVRAIDATTGKIKWEAAFNDSLRHFERFQSQGKVTTRQKDFVSEGLKERLWQNATFGTMSSDGLCVYGVENLTFGKSDHMQRLVVMPDGKRSLDPGVQKSYNMLVAYEVNSGKVKWELGGPICETQLPLAGTFFLGPPMPFGGRLYVVAKVNKLTKLMELDSESGQLLWQLPLADGSEQPTINRYARYGYRQKADDRRSGAGPSSAHGVLVCPISDNDYVAVDLATRAILWIYRTTPQDDGNAYQNRRMVMVMGGINIQQQKSKTYQPPIGWSDPSVTIADQSVLITPAQSDKLYCLDLFSGELKWTRARGDGFYVGGVQHDKVVIVGRTRIQGINLSDGKDAWKQPSIDYPPGAVPTGRGYFGKQHYFVPLSTAEIVAVNINSGRMLARTRSPNKLIPGNLISVGDTIISQGPVGLHKLPTLGQREKELRKKLEQSPSDADVLAELGGTLAYQGKLLEAVSMLRKALNAKPGHVRSQQLLAQTIVDGLNLDHAKFVSLAKELEPAIGAARQSEEYLVQLAQVYEHSRDTLSAFRTCLRLIELRKDRKLSYVGASHIVRNDRWVRAQLLRIISQAKAKDLTQIDRLVGRLVAKDSDTYYAFFDFHASTLGVRMARAEAHMEKKEWGPAENQLLSVVAHGDASLQREATVLLARLYTSAKKHTHAVLICNDLTSKLADVVCYEGKTGKAIVKQLVAESPELKAALKGPTPWPTGHVKATTLNRSASSMRGGYFYSYPMTVSTIDNRYQPRIRVEVDSRGQVLYAFDENGHQHWRVDLGNPRIRMPYVGPIYNHIHGRLNGHLFVAWLGNRVCAIDGLTGKKLWTKEIEVTATNRNQFGFVRFGGVRMAPTIAATERLPMMVLRNAVCYQLENQLIAVDPWTGEKLWTRSDIPPRSDIIGDDEMLIVSPPDSNDAFVLRTSDGHQIGQRTVPDRQKRMAVRGRNILTWEPVEGGVRWRLVDPWTRTEVWSRKFAPKTKSWVVNNDEVASLTEDGTIVVQRIADGRQLMRSNLKLAHAVQGMYIQKIPAGYLVIANDQMNYTDSGSSNLRLAGLPVHGTLFSIDAKTGKENWQCDVRRQRLRINQPTNVPALVFVNYIYERVNRSTRREFNVLCLDKRNGKKVFSSKSTSSDTLYKIQSDAIKKTLEIQLRRKRVQLKFTSDEPPKASPKAKTTKGESLSKRPTRTTSRPGSNLLPIGPRTLPSAKPPLRKRR